MYSFKAHKNLRFRCEADFVSGAYLNLHFLDAERRTIPFHLSLRRDEGLIVLNRRDAAGWRREIRLPHSFARRAVPVELAFSAGRVTVWVDGVRAGRFDRLPRPDRGGRYLLRRGFPDLPAIAHVDVEGACRADSVQIEDDTTAAQAPARGLALTAALDVAFHGLMRNEAEGLRRAAAPALLRVAGTDEPFAATLRAAAGARGGVPELLIPLPGRVWAGVDGALDLTLAGPDGTLLGTLALDRRQIAERIGALADGGGLIHADRAALTALEHARHADLLPMLTPTQRDTLFSAAERFGLTAYLTAETDVPAVRSEPAAGLLKTPSAETALTEARRLFGQRVGGAEGGDPVALLDRLRTETGLPDAVLPDLLLAMTEWFCQTDRLHDLARYWQDNRLPPAATLRDGTAWKGSAILPLAYAQGDFDAVRDGLWALTEARTGWIVTPGVGWIAGQVAQCAEGPVGGAPSPDQRRDIIGRLLTWVDAYAPEYWSQTPCLRLIDGLVSLLAAWRTLGADQRKAMEWALIRAFGLMPAFWDRVAARRGPEGWDLPDLIAEAHTGFERLSRWIVQDTPYSTDARAGIDAALGFFQHIGNVDYLRFRHDLLGPSGMPLAEGQMPGWEAGLKAGVDPLDAALRWATHPGTVPPASAAPAAFRGLLRAGIAAAYDKVPTGAFADLQAQVFDRASAMLTDDDPALSDAFLRDLVPVAGADGGYLGIGLAVSAAGGLLSRGRAADAARFGDWIERLGAGFAEPWERRALAEAAATRSAFDALHRAHPGDPLTRRVGAALGLTPDTLPPAPRDDRAGDLSTRANPMLNTLVAIYTCQPNLPTRVQAIRDGWAGQLAALGIPYLVFVGDGDGRREGDVVYLDAPDSYEALPQKSLALARWVLNHTGFSRVHKIDDDCFLDARAFHGGLSPLKADYYGRPLSRRRGEMDRTWHMAKSQSARGRLELDKSPEPSIYADGSTSWVLSRRGMAALTEAADSPEGQDLIRHSFMEDKLVGDLLATRDIWVNGEDFRTAILRRTEPGGPLVPQWENGLLPFDGSGIKLAHLDGHDRQRAAMEASQRPWPGEAKVWPSYQKARFGWSSNTLDLISSRETLRRVNDAPVTVVACLRNEVFLLERFLDHYRALGVQGFLIADNGSDDGGFAYLADQPDVALFAVDTDYSHSQYGVAWQQALMANFRCGRWSLAADADEFLFWRRDLRGSLPDLTRGLDDEGADAARVFMLDMYPQGSLSTADFRGQAPFEQAPFVDSAPLLRNEGARGPFSNAPVWTSALRHRLIPGSRPDLFVAQKYALMKYRPWMRLSAGLHFVANARLSRQELFFGHFKYNAAFRAKAQAEVARRQHFNNAEEYRKYLALVSEGRDVVFDPAVSVRWDQCAAVTDRMASE